jgi:hypothetical protein
MASANPYGYYPYWIQGIQEKENKMNRLLTTLVQLFLLGVTIPLVRMVIKDIKENGLD